MSIHLSRHGIKQMPFSSLISLHFRKFEIQQVSFIRLKLMAYPRVGY